MPETVQVAEVDDLPPSAKLVYKVLEYHGAQTQKELVEESMLSARTVRYGLGRLEERELISRRVYGADARQRLYELTTDPDGQRADPTASE